MNLTQYAKQKLRFISLGWTRVLGVGALSLLLLVNPVLAKEAELMASDAQVEARLVHIADELRCLVCQNESLASSRADLAEDLRAQVREQIVKGKTDQEIKDYLVERYGDFVLYRPAVKPMTWLLWFGPFACLLIGLVILLMVIDKRNKKIQSQQLATVNATVPDLNLTPDSHMGSHAQESVHHAHKE
jgi:cytochrome c-type biogenesis protein CcmH